MLLFKCRVSDNKTKGQTTQKAAKTRTDRKRKQGESERERERESERERKRERERARERERERRGDKRAKTELHAERPYLVVKTFVGNSIRVTTERG